MVVRTGQMAGNADLRAKSLPFIAVIRLELLRTASWPQRCGAGVERLSRAVMMHQPDVKTGAERVGGARIHCGWRMCIATDVIFCTIEAQHCQLILWRAVQNYSGSQ